MTGAIVLIVVLVLLTTRTRRARRRWRELLSTLGLGLAWLAASMLFRSPEGSQKPLRTSTRPPAPRPPPVVTRSVRTWPLAPRKLRRYAPGDDRPGQGPRYFTRAQKAELLLRSGYQCEHRSSLGIRCHRRTELRADHRHPYSWGGRTILENGQILCDPHNVEKGAHWTDVRDPALLELVCVPHMLPRNRFGIRKARA